MKKILFVLASAATAAAKWNGSDIYEKEYGFNESYLFQ